MNFAIAIAISAAFIGLQMYFFSKTWKQISVFGNFFSHDDSYGILTINAGNERIPQIEADARPESDFSKLTKEINHYILKTKGTSDFSIIQNKVERKLNMRYDQSSARLSFPTYLGLMGTFTGVFIGIWMFNTGFDGAGNISDNSIQSLLAGVMMSMATSLFGLAFTTWNTGRLGKFRKKIEEEKNEFYDFIQTELMPEVDASMVAAITRLHSTVDKFEPAFNTVITRFQETFDRCTKAFGEDFERHVNSISTAVAVMGENMDKINENIRLQENLISAVKSDEIARGLEKFLEASQRFSRVTKAIESFEDTRNRLLEAVNNTIESHERFNESLDVPRKIALALNRILNRLSTFEDNINKVGMELNNENLVGKKYLEAIDRQLSEIERKGAIANRYFETADGKLEDLFNEQTKVINALNDSYKAAIESHTEGFDRMLNGQMAQIEKHHNEFVEALKAKFDAEEVRKEFTNLRSLSEIEKKMSEIVKSGVQASDIENLQKEVAAVSSELKIMKSELKDINSNTKKGIEAKSIGKIFGFGRQ